MFARAEKETASGAENKADAKSDTKSDAKSDVKSTEGESTKASAACNLG